MANKLKLAHERRKLALRAMIMNNRAKVAELQEKSKRAREELRSMSPKRNTPESAAAALRTVRL